MENFFYLTFFNNNIMAEIVCLILAIVTLGFMLETKPRPTKVYFFNFMGIICSIFSIIILMFMAVFAKAMGSEHILLTRIYIFIFDIVYCAILDSIYCYIDSLTHTQFIGKREIKKHIIGINIIYLLICFYFDFTKDIVIFKDSEVVFLEPAYFYLFAGIFTAFCCLTSAIIYRKYIPRIIFRYLVLFAILDIVILVAQILFRATLFEGVSYVFPLVIFYLLFHSNPMDENNGCRNEFSFENHIQHCKNWKKKHGIINVYFPYIKNIENTDRELLQFMVSYACREVEQLNHSITIYSKNSYTYNIIIEDVDDNELSKIALKVQEIISRPMNTGNAKITITNKIIAVNKTEYLNKLDRYLLFVKFIDKKYFHSRMENEIYFTKDEDFIEFEKQNRIYEMLASIRDNYDLDDERVLCYAQPIYEIDSKSFKTAEALMRLKLDDKIIFPNEFIPIAEENNLIHYLTCIMINKVCKKVRELEKEYDFDAITINSSTMEFDDVNFNEEIFEIIERNHISPDKIRIELTESNMIESMGNIVSNMKKMKEKGIYCYLDDFGTGYSNLERIFGCPFKTIKFDKSVLYTSLNDSAMDDIMLSMIDAFKKKGYNVLVEGVENEEMRDKCINSGFEYIQGYYYSKPIPIDELRTFFTKKQ